MEEEMEEPVWRNRDDRCRGGEFLILKIKIQTTPPPEADAVEVTPPE